MCEREEIKKYERKKKKVKKPHNGNREKRRDSKLLSDIPRPIDGNTDNNLESPGIYDGTGIQKENHLLLPTF
jgi:hypothetical protein